MYKHLDWANQRILETLQNAVAEQKQANYLFSHVLHAENVWFTRLTGSDSSHLPIWSEISLHTCTDLVKQNNQNFSRFLLNLSTDELDHIVFYKNSKGTEF